MENQKLDVYEIVTERIIQQLEAGTVPWRVPWTDAGLPKNLLTKKPYRGVNVMLLNSLGFSQNFFLTFEQAKAVGASVKKGAKSQLVIFWKWVDTDEPASSHEKKKQKPMLRYYHLFNIAQCTGIPEDYLPLVRKENNPIEACERIVTNMPQKPEIQHWENRAFYSTEHDMINVPDIAYFVESEAYYATLFHELIHSTGHESRLNRKELTTLSKFGTDLYATEELVAEIGSCYLQSTAGIFHNKIENSAAYIQGWLTKLKNDKRCIIYASGLAQKATDYILNLQSAEVEETENIQQPQTAAA